MKFNPIIIPGLAVGALGLVLSIAWMFSMYKAIPAAPIDSQYNCVPKRDYQLDVTNGKHHNILYTLYDGNRVVGTVNSACSLDSLVEFDNQ